jgi:hypothetical protein
LTIYRQRQASLHDIPQRALAIDVLRCLVSLGTLYISDGALVGPKLAVESYLEVLFDFIKRCPDGLACRVKHPFTLRATPATETLPSDPYQLGEGFFWVLMEHANLTNQPSHYTCHSCCFLGKLIFHNCAVLTSRAVLTAAILWMYDSNY